MTPAPVRTAKSSIGDWIAALFLLVIVYVLVRPSSAAADAVDLFSKAMSAVVRATTDMDVAAPRAGHRATPRDDSKKW